MQKCFLLFGLLTMAFFMQAQENKEPYLTRSLAADNVKLVEASTQGGSISVTGATAEKARIEVYVTGNNNATLSKEEIKSRMDEMYSLDIDVADSKLTASAKAKKQIKDWKRSLNISYKIFVPQPTSTQLNTSGGSIHLVDLSGTQKFTTSGGSLHLAGLSGTVNGRTSGGSIHLENSKDDIELHTSGGSIHAKACSGNIRLQTSGGSLDLSQLKGVIKATTSGGNVDGSAVEGELIAHTSGGNVRLKNMMSSLETSTSGGNIDVSFQQMGKYLRVNNSAGNVVLTLPKNAGLDLDLSGEVETKSLSNFSGKIGDNEIKGKLNGGGVPVTVDANSGRIKLALQ